MEPRAGGTRPDSIMDDTTGREQTSLDRGTQEFRGNCDGRRAQANVEPTGKAETADFRRGSPTRLQSTLNDHTGTD